MLVMETIAKIRLDHLVRGVPIKKIARDLRVSKNTVRKVVRGDETSFSYERKIQPMPKLGPWVEELERQLEANEKKGRKDRLSLLRIHEDLASLGYEGGYDAVRRYARAWRRRWRLLSPSQAFVPLSFDPGEAYQFDWSHEYARLSGVTTRVKAAHMRLCHSRMQLVQIFPRESQEMVFEAHERAFRFFGGVCRRGIYDNMKTAVSTVFVGKKRDYNRRFQEMCSHHLVEPVACTPGAGWEKGQVERQVGDVRGRLFVPSPRGRSYAEINEWLMDRCIEDAKKHPHPTIPGKTVSQVFEEERPFLMAYRGPFDGFHATEVAVSKTCLVRFDNNQYSVAARAVGRPVDVRAYADRIAIRQDGEIVAEHPRSFGRGQVHLRSVALRADPDEEARRAAQRRALQGLAVAQRARAPANPARGPRRRRPAVRQGARGGAGGRTGGGRGGLRRGARLRRLQRRRRAQHPRPAAPAGAAGGDPDARGPATPSPAGCRLSALRQPEGGRSWSVMMCWR